MGIDEFIEEWNNDADNIVAFTSGSTGEPKRILLSKQLMKESALRTIRYFSLNSDSHLHLCLSPDYIAGKMMIVRSILSGAYLSYEEPSNRLKALSSENIIDLLAVVPSQLLSLLEEKDLSRKVRNIIVGGAPLSRSLKDKCRKSDVRIVETYGMTETASHVALREISSDWFHPLDGVKVALSSEGTLNISIQNFGTFRTTDLAEINSEGGFRILGRADDVIITGGLKVHPADLEDKITESVDHFYPDTAFCISSIPDEKWGEIIVLNIESHENKEIDDQLNDCFRRILKPHERPGIIKHFERLPRTESGKIARRLLK